MRDAIGERYGVATIFRFGALTRLPLSLLLQRNITEFKLLLVGDSGVGKTAFVTQFLTGEFPSRYLPTVGVDVNPLEFHSNFGPIVFQCWQISRDEMLTDHQCMDAHCAIIMFDVTSRVTFQNVAKWYRDIVRVCGEIPIVLCGNKVDAADSRARVKHLNIDRTMSLPYFEISAAAQRAHGWDGPFALFNQPMDEPIVWLARKLMGFVISASASYCPSCCCEPLSTCFCLRSDENLFCVEPIHSDPSDGPFLTPELIAQLEAENARAAVSVPLPDEYEDL
jgi:GTP-binding nuclear protein Ran